jgi:glycosyltransferase involved in cell wall biosynthesis
VSGPTSISESDEGGTDATPPAPAPPPSGQDRLREIAEEAGIHRVDVVAWRDLDDAEAGGSELHAHEVLRRWAAAGIDVRQWTSRVDGAAREITRDGYTVNRRAGRYAVFPRTAFAGVRAKIGTGDGLVEIWNGMPFFSPLWNHRPRVVFLHHVHAEMWQMVLSPRLATLGYAVEHRLAPPFYRNTRIVTLSGSAKLEIVEKLRLKPANITVVPPGIDPKFSPAPSATPAAGAAGPVRDPDPLVVAVGRLVPVKRFDLFIAAMVALKARQPKLRAVVVGEGYERPELEAQIAQAGATEWLTMPGRLADHELLSLYRRASIVGSTSKREGWGMTLTEGAACGTPAVATRITGHDEAVIDGESGLLVDGVEDFVAAADSILTDPMLRRRLEQGALRNAERLSWEVTAAATLEVLAAEVNCHR